MPNKTKIRWTDAERRSLAGYVANQIMTSHGLTLAVLDVHGWLFNQICEAQKHVLEPYRRRKLATLSNCGDVAPLVRDAVKILDAQRKAAAGTAEAKPPLASPLPVSGHPSTNGNGHTTNGHATNGHLQQWLLPVTAPSAVHIPSVEEAVAAASDEVLLFEASRRLVGSFGKWRDLFGELITAVVLQGESMEAATRSLVQAKSIESGSSIAALATKRDRRLRIMVIGPIGNQINEINREFSRHEDVRVFVHNKDQMTGDLPACDHVVLMAKFVSHSHQSKVYSLFDEHSRDRVHVLQGGGLTDVRATIWSIAQGAREACVA